MTSKRLETLEGEFEQFKVAVEERLSNLEGMKSEIMGEFASMKERFANLEKMMKKILELHTPPAGSAAWTSNVGHERGGNPYSSRLKEEQEGEILEERHEKLLEDGEKIEEEEEEEEQLHLDVADVSLNFMVRITSDDTMKMEGEIEVKTVVVQVNCGVTHNFIFSGMADFQEHFFSWDWGSTDVIWGMKRLRARGEMKMDWKSLTMEIQVEIEGRKVKMKWFSPTLRTRWIFGRRVVLGVQFSPKSVDMKEKGGPHLGGQIQRRVACCANQEIRGVDSSSKRAPPGRQLKRDWRKREGGLLWEGKSH